MVGFALILESWDWRELRAVGIEDNVARFRNESGMSTMKSSR
jgi:hypothetical protein